MDALRFVPVPFRLIRRVVWIPEAQEANASENSGFSLFYQAIAMHAVCRDISDFPHPCVYLQLDPEQNVGDLASLFEAETQDSKRARQVGVSHTSGPAVGGMPVEVVDGDGTSPVAGEADDDGEEGEEEEEEEEDPEWPELRLVPVAEGASDASAMATGSDETASGLDAIYAVGPTCLAP